MKVSLESEKLTFSGKVEGPMEFLQLTDSSWEEWDIFENSKENIAVIHPLHGEGDNFKILGCQFDTKLTMIPAIDKIISTIRPKIKATLRTIGIYSIEEMLH